MSKGDYLFKNPETRDIQVGKPGAVQFGRIDQNEELETQGKYSQKRNEFLERNRELQESLWRGRDSASMSDVKNSYSALKDFMNEEIPEYDLEFNERKTAIEDCYNRLITHCQEYLNSHKNPFTKEGKHRKAMVAAILSNSAREKASLSIAAQKLSARKEKGMIWGNLFGEMTKNVDLCTGVYSQLDNRLGENSEVPAGAKTLELANVLSAGMIMKETDERGQLISDMTLIWTKDNITDDLKKEFRQFRKFITRIVVNNYKTALASRAGNFAFYPSPETEEKKRQYILLTIINSDQYTLYKALKELAPSLGEDPAGCGVEGEELISGIQESTAYFNQLFPGMVRESLDLISYYRRVNARSFLNGYLESEKLDRLLGEDLQSRQTNARPYDMRVPTPAEAGTEKLENELSVGHLLQLVNGSEKYREDVVAGEEGADVFEKWMNVKQRIVNRHGNDVFNHDIVNYDGTIHIQGLNTARVFGKLMGTTGGTLTPAEIEDLYDKLLSRSKVGVGEGKITAEESDRRFNEGMYRLTDIYLEQLRRMEATYGRLIGQMHPEDIGRQFGDELFDHLAVIQDTEQLKGCLLKHGNPNSLKVREFIMLSDYFNDIFNRSFVYLQQKDIQNFSHMHDYLEGSDPVRNLLSVDRFDSIKGPRMNGSQKKKYNANLKKRFHQKGGTWDSRLFSEFRGMQK